MAAQLTRCLLAPLKNNSLSPSLSPSPSLSQLPHTSPPTLIAAVSRFFRSLALPHLSHPCTPSVRGTDATMAPLKLAAPLALLALAVTTSAKLEPRSSGATHVNLAARKPSRSFENKWLASNYKDGDEAPDAKSGDAGGQTIVLVGKGGQDVQVDS